MYAMFDLNFPGMKLVKSELKLHGVVENHTYIENRLLLEKSFCRIPVSIYFLVVVAEQWSMLSDNIFATFYIEQSDSVSCCGGQLCY